MIGKNPIFNEFLAKISDNLYVGSTFTREGYNVRYNMRPQVQLFNSQGCKLKALKHGANSLVLYGFNQNLLDITVIENTFMSRLMVSFPYNALRPSANVFSSLPAQGLLPANV